MISKTGMKYIKSLQNKKVREDEKLYIIEGDKLVKEFLSAKAPVKLLIAESEFLINLKPGLTDSAETIENVTYNELKQISSLKTPQSALAVVHIPEKKIDFPQLFSHYCIALDQVQDPGNLGTIIRAAGWFGIRNIVCSPDSADVYNPKVIQASMGAILHVNVYYLDLKELLVKASQNSVSVFGTMLEGTSVYDHKPGSNGIILFGNESKGISDDLIPFITEKITIPKYSNETEGIDSLNVGMAASVVFSEFIRKKGSLSDY